MTHKELKEMVISRLTKRWSIDPVFVECRMVELNLIVPKEFANIAEWYEKKAPLMTHPYWLQIVGTDMRGIDASGLHLTEKHWLSDSILDYSNFSNGVLEKIHAQNAVFNFANFTGAHLKSVQMSPIYAHMADFTDAVIEGGFFQSGGSKVIPHCSLFTMTKLIRAKVTKAAFVGCDFKGAAFEDAVFTDCEFRGADFRYISANINTRFINCDFENAIFQDHEPVRQYLQNTTVFQNCTGLDQLNWVYA